MITIFLKSSLIIQAFYSSRPFVPDSIEFSNFHFLDSVSISYGSDSCHFCAWIIKYLQYVLLD